MEKLLIQTAPGLQTQVWFADQGKKLAVYHHGVPKPRLLTEAELAVFAEFGYSVACLVRQGYLESTPVEESPMASSVPAVSTIARELGFEAFLSLGFSGGGPRALADLALNPAANAAVLFGSVAPATLDFDYYGSFPPEEGEMFDALRNQGMLMLPMFEEWAASSPDLNVGAQGWICDELAMLGDWGFEPAKIAKPVLLLTSPDDHNVPSSHTEWLASKMTGSAVISVPGLEHDDLVNPATIRTALERLS
ncbi:MAG: hypothetical protein RLZ69_1189 [Actinomycetota bacterium]